MQDARQRSRLERGEDIVADVAGWVIAWGLLVSFAAGALGLTRRAVRWAWAR